MNIKMIILVCAVLVVLSLAGWLLLRPKGSAVTVQAGAKAGDIFLQPCTVKVDGVAYQADCGTLVVPENRDDPASRLIALPIRRIHSTNPQPAEAIFYLSGGPGSSNMGFKPPAWLLANHDVVLVGYRGVDGTPKLDCPESRKALKRWSPPGSCCTTRALICSVSRPWRPFVFWNGIGSMSEFSSKH